MTTDDANLPRFEVASVKPGDPGIDHMGWETPPGRYIQENANLVTAVEMAFGIRPYQLERTGLPELVQRGRFFIDARMPAGAPLSDRPLMLRALLIDRFKLRYHIEHGHTDGYVLTLARRDGRLGPRLRPSTLDCATRLAALARKQELAPLPAGAVECGIRNGPGLLNFGGMPMSLLVTMLSNQTGAPVVDQTGLAGAFDVELRFSPGSAGQPSPDAPAPSSSVDDAPSIFTAVQEQLGLKLTPGKAPMDRLVIDRIERPDPD